MTQTRQAKVGHFQRRTVGTQFECLTGGQLKIASPTSVVTTASQMSGKVTRMPANPHRETLFYQGHDLAVYTHPLIPRAGKIGRFLKHLMCKLVLTTTALTFDRLDNFEPPHLLQRTVELGHFKCAAFGEKIETKTPPQHCRHVGYLTVTIELIDTPRQQAEQPLGQLIELHATPFAAVHFQASTNLLHIERHPVTALDDLAAQAGAGREAITAGHLGKHTGRLDG